MDSRPPPAPTSVASMLLNRIVDDLAPRQRIEYLVSRRKLNETPEEKREFDRRILEAVAEFTAQIVVRQNAAALTELMLGKMPGVSLEMARSIAEFAVKGVLVDIVGKLRADPEAMKRILAEAEEEEIP